MSPIVLGILVPGLFIAYVNGSNDVAKGIATLVGSGVSNYRRALLWGAVWTGIGGLAGGVFASAMVETFGKGLLAVHTVPTVSAALASIIGAAAWVAIATRFSLPVSTTHALAGAIGGVAVCAYGIAGVNWSAFEIKIVLPLLLSPIAALLATSIFLRFWSSRSSPLAAADCACLEIHSAGTFAADASGAVAMGAAARPQLDLVIAPRRECAVDHPRALPLTLAHLHWVTSGATSFARGLNDAPKMAALVLAAASITNSAAEIRPWVFASIALGMVAGSWLGGRRVTGLLAEKVTAMDNREGFTANLVTAALVGPGAALGLPMSTTHVSSGAIVALGMNRTGGLNWAALRQIAIAWVVTAPAAALLGVGTYAVLRVDWFWRIAAVMWS